MEVVFFFFKQKTAYEMRISDWSSDVCSSDLSRSRPSPAAPAKTPTTAASSASPSTRLVETPKICGRTGTQCVLWRPQILEIAGASGAGEAVDHGGEIGRAHV